MTIKRHKIAQKRKKKQPQREAKISVKTHEVITKRHTAATDAQNHNKEMDSDKQQDTKMRKTTANHFESPPVLVSWPP